MLKSFAAKRDYQCHANGEKQKDERRWLASAGRLDV
jgi:hypothetical protein